MSNSNFQYSFFSDSHVGNVRKANEDFHGERVTPHGHVFVVCDGMGGHVGGATASQLAVNSILEYFEKASQENTIQLIHEAIKFANTQVHGMSETTEELKGMGTTCVVLVVTHTGAVFMGHVGDSRVYYLNERKLRRMTRDHSYVQFLVDTGEITEQEAELHPKRNQILKALGQDEVVKPDVSINPLLPVSNSQILLCSDGLCGMIDDERIKEILLSSSSASGEQTVSKLIEAALAAGGKDNVTATLIRITHSDFKETPETAGAAAVDTGVKKSGIKKLLGRYKKPLLLILFLVILIPVWILMSKRGDGKQKPVKENQHEVQDSLGRSESIIGKDSGQVMKELDTTNSKFGEDTVKVDAMKDTL